MDSDCVHLNFRYWCELMVLVPKAQRRQFAFNKSIFMYKPNDLPCKSVLYSTVLYNFAFYYAKLNALHCYCCTVSCMRL